MIHLPQLPQRNSVPREEDAETAAALEAFSASLAGGGVASAPGGALTWVRGGAGDGSPGAGGGAGASSGAAGGTMRLYVQAKPAAADVGNAPAAAPLAAAASSGRRRREVGEQLLRDIQGLTGPGAAGGAAPQAQANLFVRELAPLVTEEDLVALFRPFGPLVSVKVLWPRTEEERARGRNAGFVQFERSRDAAAAFAALQDAPLRGLCLRLDWARPVAGGTLPSSPPPQQAPPPPPSQQQQPRQAAAHPAAPLPTDIVIPVELPLDARQRAIMDCVAALVAADGAGLEEALLAAEGRRLGWLRAPPLYYRWRVAAFAHGDGPRAWREAPFELQAGGPWLLPPPVPASCAGDPAAAAAAPPALPAPVAATWAATLASLTLSRASISNASTWALDHADAAAAVGGALCAALRDAAAPPPLTAARLYLLSDILANAGAPARNASLFRSVLGEGLPDVFEALARALRACPGRMTREGLRSRALRVLAAWEAAAVFPPLFLLGLEATLLRPAAAAPTREAGGVGRAPPPPPDLTATCRAAGLSCEGGASAMAVRVAAMEAYARVKMGLGGRAYDAEGGEAGAGEGADAPAPAAPDAEVDTEPEEEGWGPGVWLSEGGAGAPAAASAALAEQPREPPPPQQQQQQQQPHKLFSFQARKTLLDET